MHAATITTTTADMVHSNQNELWCTVHYYYWAGTTGTN